MIYWSVFVMYMCDSIYDVVLVQHLGAAKEINR